MCGRGKIVRIDIMKFVLKIRPSKLKDDEISLPLVILLVIATVGLLSVVGARVDVLKILKKRRNKKWLCPSHVNNCLNRLINNGLIIKDKNGHLSLSSTGELRLLRYQEEIERNDKKWDGKWRIVIFDIWEKNKRKRDLLRQELIDFGFIKLQNSVWITPYDCEDYVNLLKTDLGVGKGVIYIVADKVDNEITLRKKFELD